MVRSRLCLRRTFERQRPLDHLTSDAGRLREAYSGARKKHCGSNNDYLLHNPFLPKPGLSQIETAAALAKYSDICTRSTSARSTALGRKYAATPYGIAVGLINELPTIRKVSHRTRSAREHVAATRTPITSFPYPCPAQQYARRFPDSYRSDPPQRWYGCLLRSPRSRRWSR